MCVCVTGSSQPAEAAVETDRGTEQHIANTADCWLCSTGISAFGGNLAGESTVVCLCASFFCATEPSVQLCIFWQCLLYLCNVYASMFV